MVKKIIYIFIVLFLLANFCWDGRPVWKYLVPVAEDVTEEGGDKLKDAGKVLKKGLDGSKKAIEKAGKSLKEGADKVKESVKNIPGDGITEKDKEDLKELIKKKSEKEKK